MKKSILVTGGAGFIGSNFIEYFMKKYPDYHIVNLDKLTYAGSLSNLHEVESNQNYYFIHGDICDRELVKHIFSEFKINGVIHFAAESHVDNSLTNPDEFIRTNIMGTFTLIDVAKQFWINKAFEYKKQYQGSRFHHVSTDEVYGTLGTTGFFTEESPYAPNSPYSVSKASSDMIVRGYNRSLGIDTTITNSSNNFGQKQHGEKLIPTIIRNAVNGNPIPIYGDGKNVRDWIYVLDNCKAIDLIFHKGISGESYNVGARNELRNTDIAKTICKMLDGIRPQNNGKSYKDLITFVSDRPGHDRRYAIDPTKIERLGWHPETEFKKALLETIKWYLHVQ